jgi:anti-sigma B factor antagonist
MALNVRVEDRQGFTKTMFVEGRLDSTTAPQFDSELDGVLELPMKVLVLDLSKLEYLSSAGIRSLFRVQKTMKARAGKALLVNLQPPVQKVLEIVKAVDLKTVFASVRELDEYLDSLQNPSDDDD